MSVGDTIAKEAQEFLSLNDADYYVDVQFAGMSHDWFYLSVFYRDQQIARWSCCRSYRIARWRAARRIRQHRRFVKAMTKAGVRT